MPVCTNMRHFRGLTAVCKHISALQSVNGNEIVKVHACSNIQSRNWSLSAVQSHRCIADIKCVLLINASINSYAKASLPLQSTWMYWPQVREPQHISKCAVLLLLKQPCAVINASGLLAQYPVLTVHCLAPYYTPSTAVSFSVKAETDTTDISTMGTQHFYSDSSKETILHSPMPCSHWKLPNKAIEIFDCLLRLDKTIIRTSRQQRSKFDVNRFCCLLPTKGWDGTGELWCLSEWCWSEKSYVFAEFEWKTWLL